MDELYNWIDELHAELSAAKIAVQAARKEVKSQQTKLDNTKALALKRIALLKSLKLNLDEAQDKLAEESHQCEALEKMRTIQLDIKRERPVGRPGSAKRWSVHIVLLICELLVNGTHPSAVPVNI